MIVRLANPGDIEMCVEVLAALPEFFTEDTHDDIRATDPRRTVVVGEIDGRIIGFVLAERRYDLSAEILYAAVRPELRSRGIGKNLVEHVCHRLADAGVVIVSAKTLDASAGYEPYVATRAFWELRGFIQIECIDPLPGWQPGNPSAIYVRACNPSD